MNFRAVVGNRAAFDLGDGGLLGNGRPKPNPLTSAVHVAYAAEPHVRQQTSFTSELTVSKPGQIVG